MRKECLYSEPSRKSFQRKVRFKKEERIVIPKAGLWVVGSSLERSSKGARGSPLYTTVTIPDEGEWRSPAHPTMCKVLNRLDVPTKPYMHVAIAPSEPCHRDESLPGTRPTSGTGTQSTGRYHGAMPVWAVETAVADTRGRPTRDYWNDIQREDKGQLCGVAACANGASSFREARGMCRDFSGGATCNRDLRSEDWIFT